MEKRILHLLGYTSIVALIALNAPTTMSQPVAISSEQVLGTEARIDDIGLIPRPEATSATSTQMAQVTSVSQLSDIQPSDWAFQALQSLIERYGVVADYPNSTYQGNRSLTRYEFAAGLNAVLQHLIERITVELATQLSREDLVTVQRLQQEFALELATLRGRIDNMEARASEVEANQFSTTTKLLGQAIFAVNAGGFSGDRIVAPTGAEITNNQPNATFIYRAALNLDTSFSGTDLLKLRLDTLSGRGNDNAAGFLEPNLGSVQEFTVRGTPNQQFGISRLYYTFTPYKDLSLTIGPALVATDYVDINSYANGNAIDFSTLALVNNYLLFPINGPSAGAVLQWNPGQGPFKVRALYVAADAANPNSNSQTFVGSVFPFARLLYPNRSVDRGFFGDLYQSTVELEYSPSNALAVRLQYSGGDLFDNRFDVFGVNLELAFSQQLGVFGRYGYGSYHNTDFGDINPNYWMTGFSFRDLLVQGAVAGIAIGQPFIESAVGNATQMNIEAFYNFPVSNNIRVTPLLQVIVNPGNQNSNGTIVTGTLRTVFSF